ncbi:MULTISPECIES: replication initiation protein RepM [Psychrobacter]|uniref:replication initiation protein RepM n=1 Tax=Psychrobacter TaxID=497 RepID=UPI00146C94C0|nr:MULTISPECIES: replication initiation protein RepM [Psychrobacter]
MSDLVVKDNALIQASYTLDLAEQRLILLAIVEARESNTGIRADSLLRIHSHNYAKNFGVNNETAYTVMKEACKGLFDRYVTYHDKNPKTGNDRSFHCRWVDKIGYETNTGIVYLRFTHDVVPLITRLEAQFTSYELAQVKNLTSSYAIRLYELLIQWRSVGKTPLFELQEFRQQLGVEGGEYKTMSNFKANVLNIALSQINKHTDIEVKYDQKKCGRNIVGFFFTFKQKKPLKEKTVKATSKTQDNNINGLTDKQLARIVKNPQFISDYNHLVSPNSPANQSPQMWEAEMVSRIKKDASVFNKRPLRDYLK